MKAVLFDFHNTLVTCDTWLDLEINTLPSLALNLLRAHGELANALPHDSAGARERFRALRQIARDSGVEVSAVDGVRRVLAEMGYKPSKSAIEEAVAELEEHCLLEVEPVSGAVRALEQLRDSGYLLGVVSSAGWPPFVEMALEAEGMRPFFSVVITSAGEGIYKSDPEIFRRTCARLGVEPAEAWHVGDHARYDVQTARTAGLRAVWFNAHARRTALLHNADWDELERQGAQADAVISRLSQLPGAIRAAETS
jgi:FMN phosphatase YigB (HAD superfamily)